MENKVKITHKGEDYIKVEVDGEEFEITNPAMFIVEILVKQNKKAIEFGRLSVLKDFDSLISADAIVGFTEEEFKAIKKFFEWNKAISGWDK